MFPKQPYFRILVLIIVPTLLSTGCSKSSKSGEPCTHDCESGAAQCVADQRRQCTTNDNECRVWSPLQPCPKDAPMCSNGQCSNECQPECDSDGQRRCEGQGYQLCGQHDSDPCLDWSPMLSCAKIELCEGGECVPECDGAPCPCTAGQTEPCADVGECSGGERQCVNGTFGPCQWLVSPEPEICDGLDNDCNGQMDDALAAPGCDLQQGICQGAVKSCGGSQSWLPCTESDYTAYDSSYQKEEALCDGKDNDCDGSVDEPGDCCQPDCSTKACGADNGCGSPCLTGSCPAGLTCTPSGQCQEVCTPQSPLELGGPGLFGYSSLAEDGNKTMHVSFTSHTNWGLWYVSETSPGVWPSSLIDTQTSHPSLAVDSGNNAHISYRVVGAEDLKYATNTSGSWVIQTLDSADWVGNGSSLAVDSADNVHISYWDSTNSTLKYVTNASGNWVPQTLDTVGSPGLSTSIAMDSGDKAHISYFDSSTGSLKYATDASGSWIVETPKPSAYGNSGGTSIAIDSGDKVHISFTAGNLWYATNASGSWDVQNIYGMGCQPETSVVVGSDGIVFVSFVDDANGELKYSAKALGGVWSYHTAYPGNYWPKTSGYVKLHAMTSGNKDELHFSFRWENETINGSLYYLSVCP